MAAVVCVELVHGQQSSKSYSWLLALTSSSPSRCHHQCLVDICSPVFWAFFLFGTCWDEQDHAGWLLVLVEVMAFFFWQMILKGRGLNPSFGSCRHPKGPG